MGVILQKDGRSFAWMNAVFATTAIVIILRLAASFYPGSRLWGLNQAAFIDGLWILYPVLLIVAVAIYWRARRSDMPSTGTSVAEIKVYPSMAIYFYLVPLGMAVVFCVLAVDAHFLGDGLQNVSSLANPATRIKPTDYGEMLLHLWFIKWFGSFDEPTARLAYRLLSILSGVAFVVAVVYYGRRITTSRHKYLSFIVFNLVMSQTILYYGYVENYSITLTALYIFMLGAVAGLYHRKKSVIPLAAFVLAVFLHRVAVIFLPVAVIYIVLSFAPMKAGRLLRNNTRVVLLSMSVAFFAFYAALQLWAPLSWRLIFLRPWPDRFTVDNYYLFSAEHIIDYANLLLFLIPVTLCVWLLHILGEKPRQSDERQAIQLFLIAAAVIGLMVSFVLDPKLGMARDWDLMALILAGTTLTGVCGWFVGYASNTRYKTASALMLILCLSLFIPWLALQNDSDGLYKYGLAVMKHNPKRSYSGLMTLIAIRRAQGDDEEADRLTEYCRELFPERRLDKAGAASYRGGDYQMAENLFRRAIDENPGWFGPYVDLAKCQIKLGQYRRALENLKIAAALNLNADILINMGQTYQFLGDTAKALRYYRQSIDIDASLPDSYLLLGDAFLVRRQADSAIFYLTRLPDTAYPSRIYYSRGLAYLMKQDTGRALRDFKEYLERGADTVIVQQINRIKSRISHTETFRSD